MQLISTFSFLKISTFFSVIEIYIKMSEISNFSLSVSISHPVSLVLSSQNAQCFYISAPLYELLQTTINIPSQYCRIQYDEHLTQLRF